NEPPAIAGPAELPAHPPRDIRIHAEPAGTGPGVVLLAHMRKVHVANLVTLVERHQHSPISNRNIPWHPARPAKQPIPRRDSPCRRELAYLYCRTFAPITPAPTLRLMTFMGAQNKSTAC